MEDFFAESIYKYTAGEIKLLAYFCRMVSGIVKLSVHGDVKWVTVNELGGFDFAPADISLIKRLKEELY
ncbi:NUDIX hydrolase [Alkaliphilus metalliredigens]|uniref:hypothetical protein n=1 Tax=Alkaliphilus metalliredigens TaxID=208226 RepID=UPI00005CBF97|nr:hypothetical protein [Alkaliphilus metalliredigens]